jgi:hypothetical protein
MVEPIGLCEKHELPLDRNGECELCRLSDMPSQAPPQRSAWWAIAIPLLILLAGAAWTYASLGTDPEEAPVQGVQAPAPRVDATEQEVAVEEAVAEEAPETLSPESEPTPSAPRPPTPPPAPEDIPRPGDFEE